MAVVRRKKERRKREFYISEKEAALGATPSLHGSEKNCEAEFFTWLGLSESITVTEAEGQGL